MAAPYSESKVEGGGGGEQSISAWSHCICLLSELGFQAVAMGELYRQRVSHIFTLCPGKPGEPTPEKFLGKKVGFGLW